MIKIMHVIHSLHTGGMENGVINLINNLDWNAFKHSVCCITTTGEMESRILRKDVKVFEMKKKEGHDFLLPFRLATVFRNERMDLVHTRNWGGVDGIAGARLAGIPAIIHGEHGREASDPLGLNVKRNLLRRALAPWVSCYITVCQDLKRWLVDVVKVKPEKVLTICNGVDTNKFYPTKDKKKQKMDYGYMSETIIIGAVGRLDRVKDFRTLIEAFSCIARRSINANLMIIGDGPDKTNLQKLANDGGMKDNILFLGMRDDVPELFRLMDAYVLPSLAEGFSNTILEAMASGIPVVATKVGGNPELVREGETGFLFLPGDREGLINILTKYLNQSGLAALHGDAGRLRAIERFSLQGMISSYEALYLDLWKKSGLREN